MFPQPEKAARLLLRWYAKEARDLPWRRTSDPYGIWIAEIMLQQTQVRTVLPYWTRWMKRVPDVQSLALAPLATVLKLWEGLGYYSRARNLQKAAQQICVEEQGNFPSKHARLLELPGIGPYTAGAICSIAFNQATPIVDGNVARVLARLDGMDQPLESKSTRAQLWSRAQELVEAAASLSNEGERRCSRLNQALMELGALICKPKAPDCGSCPVRRLCIALRTDRVNQLPVVRKRPAATPRFFVAFVGLHSGRFYVRQRPAEVVNGGLWEFPNVEVDALPIQVKETVEKCLGAPAIEFKHLCTIRHSITRYRIQLESYLVAFAEPPRTGSSGIWRSRAQLERLAFTSAHRRIVQALRKHGSLAR